jgi:hypothetical protein
MSEENFYLMIMTIPLVLAILFVLVPPRRRRRRLLEGEQYVEDTPQGKLYLAMMRRCPSCELRPPRYLEGPSGGLSTNVFCERCGQGYNITPAVGIAELIHRDTRYVIKRENVVSIVPNQDEGQR